jgi:hypothetical protein
VFQYRGSWSLLHGSLYAHAYSSWQVVLPIVLCCVAIYLFIYTFKTSDDLIGRNM